MTRLIFQFALIALCVVALPGCMDKKKQARRAELIALMHGNTPDPDIKAAMVKAKETLPEFMEAIKAPKPNQGQFMVRKAFPTKEEGKQQILIVNKVTYDGTLLHGVLEDNTAVPGNGVAVDGKVSLKPEEISDWMFNDGGKAAGGWMLRALKKKMTEQEWAGYAEKIQFKE
jgi:uncharacterized protein YegJ (DUF2314 family)